MALLTPDEAAKELNISYKHLRALTKAGLIKYVNIGCGEKYEARRYTKEDLDEFIERRKQEWQSTRNTVRRSTPTTSLFAASDFRDRRAARQKEQQKRSPKPNKPK